MKKEITKQQTKLAYQVSKKVYLHKIKNSEGRKILMDNGISLGSSSIFIDDFKRMLNGLVLKKTLNAFSFEYFLEKIYKDFKPVALSNALKSLKLNIDYYEKSGKGKHKYGRAIYEKYICLTDVEKPIDEREQNEIAEELIHENESRQKTINYLKNLKDTDPEIIIIKGKAYKRDNKTVVELKKLRNFKCQICTTTIKKVDGTYYVEAAHIDAKHKQGRETPDNILILCPNHHKEFDKGKRDIHSRDKKHIDFSINELRYKISLAIK